MYTGTGVVEDEGNYYYIYNDEVLSGWYNFDGKVMCFDKSNGYKAAVGTVIMGGKKYLFDDSGVLQLGWYHWNGMSLYFDINNGVGAGSASACRTSSVYSEQCSDLCSSGRRWDISCGCGSSYVIWNCALQIIVFVLSGDIYSCVFCAGRFAGGRI